MRRFANFACFRCGDGNTPLYCFNCANEIAKNEAKAQAGSEAGAIKHKFMVWRKSKKDAKREVWPGHESIVFGSYRNRHTGICGCVSAADFEENEIQVWYGPHIRWVGTIQEFRRDFEPQNEKGRE